MSDIRHRIERAHEVILEQIIGNGFQMVDVNIKEYYLPGDTSEKFFTYKYVFSVLGMTTKAKLSVSDTLLFSNCIIVKSEFENFFVDKYLRDFENDDRLTNGRCDSESMEVRLDFLKGYLKILFEVLTRPPLVDVLNDKKWIKISFDPDD